MSHTQFSTVLCMWNPFDPPTQHYFMKCVPLWMTLCFLAGGLVPTSSTPAVVSGAVQHNCVVDPHDCQV